MQFFFCNMNDKKNIVVLIYLLEMFGLWMDSIHCYCTQEKRNSGNHCTNQPLCPPVILVGTWKDEVKISEGEEVFILH